jgi:hypothetical protein
MNNIFKGNEKRIQKQMNNNVHVFKENEQTHTYIQGQIYKKNFTKR